MSEIKIFIEGTPGFKPAVLGKLSASWLLGSSDVNLDVISISIGKDKKLNDLQDAIGRDIISAHELQFHSDLAEYEAKSQWKYAPGGPVKMTIWANTDSKLGEKKPKDPGNKFMSKLRS